MARATYPLTRPHGAQNSIRVTVGGSVMAMARRSFLHASSDIGSYSRSLGGFEAFCADVTFPMQTLGGGFARPGRRSLISLSVVRGTD